MPSKKQTLVKTDALVVLTPEQKQVLTLQEEIAVLKNQLRKEPVNLDEQIAYFQEKEQLIKQYNKFQKNKVDLLSQLEIIQNLSQENEFVTDKYNLKLDVVSNYKNTTLFDINNPVLIETVIEHVVNCINEKMKCLEIEIAR